MTQSASFGDTTEDAVLVDPPPGNYVAHVVNFDQIDGAAAGRLEQRPGARS